MDFAVKSFREESYFSSIEAIEIGRRITEIALQIENIRKEQNQIEGVICRVESQEEAMKCQIYFEIDRIVDEKYSDLERRCDKVETSQKIGEQETGNLFEGAQNNKEVAQQKKIMIIINFIKNLILLVLDNIRKFFYKIAITKN
ncbi:MAG: hypothetical protein AMS24_03685 [Chlamydiae bacterium SM23_39]|nr:MAG: hypothetical protein AMS24_03685 [Chlamydiae bacterium SM23_39]